MAEDEQRHRLVVLGAGRVGKTSIVQRFLNGAFPRTYKPTVEDLHCRDYDINGSTIKVDVLDTAGDLAFPAMRRLSISTAHGFLLVYSVADMSSFIELKQIWEQIKEQRHNYQEMPCVMIANKCDLDSTRQVDNHDAIDWIRSEGMESAYMEISVKEDRDVLGVFQKLLEQANIPEVRKLEPILKRRLSANASHPTHNRNRLRTQEEGRLGRSRSLMRRTNKPKVKQSSDPSRNDCMIS